MLRECLSLPLKKGCGKIVKKILLKIDLKVTSDFLKGNTYKY